MLLPLLGTAALLSFHAGHAVARGDTSFAAGTASPTITHTPVVGIKSHMVADSIVVDKTKRTLTLYEMGEPVHVYQVALGPQPKGDKVRMGDGRTPEGVYHIDYKNPQSKYHMALHISYPDAAHLQRASALGVSPGGDIMIHGLPPAYKSIGAEQSKYDWTEGCIAVTDQEIEQIWAAVPQGAPIQIKP
ncbi:MAG: murein L,D-transpeptidase family protein [Gemmatimonadales bacterium]